MIGLALLVQKHELWVSVTNTYRDLSPDHFELSVDHVGAKIESVERIDPSRWAREFGWKEGWELWSIRFSSSRVDTLTANLRISFLWNGHTVSQRTPALFRTLLSDYHEAGTPFSSWENCFPKCTETESQFRLWAPFAKKVSLLFYDRPEALKPSWLLSMKRDT